MPECRHLDMARFWGVLFGIGFILLALFVLEDLEGIFIGCKIVWFGLRNRSMSDALE